MIFSNKIINMKNKQITLYSNFRVKTPTFKLIENNILEIIHKRIVKY